VVAQNEIWNTFVEVRYGLLHERDDGLSLAVGAGGGQAVTLVSAIGDEVDADDALVLLDPANVGGRVFERHEPKTTRAVDKTKKADPPPTTPEPSTVPASQPPASTTTTPPASTATPPPSTIG